MAKKTKKTTASVIPFRSKKARQTASNHQGCPDCEEARDEGKAEQEAFQSAQAVCVEAFEHEDSSAKVAMALRALSMHAKCTDAWFLLAMNFAEDPISRLGLLRNGVFAALEFYGERLDLMAMWTSEETRPLMRCRFAMAQTFWESGLKEEAMGEAADMLMDNPTDDQGIRFSLMGWFLGMGMYEAAEDLLEDYDRETSPEWVVARIAVGLKTKTLDRKAAQALLKEDPEASLSLKALLNASRETDAPACTLAPLQQGDGKLWATIQELAAEAL